MKRRRTPEELKMIADLLGRLEDAFSEKQGSAYQNLAELYQEERARILGDPGTPEYEEYFEKPRQSEDAKLSFFGKKADLQKRAKDRILLQELQKLRERYKPGDARMAERTKLRATMAIPETAARGEMKRPLPRGLEALLEPLKGNEHWQERSKKSWEYWNQVKAQLEPRKVERQMRMKVGEHLPLEPKVGMSRRGFLGFAGKSAAKPLIRKAETFTPGSPLMSLLKGIVMRRLR